MLVTGDGAVGRVLGELGWGRWRRTGCVVCGGGVKHTYVDKPLSPLGSPSPQEVMVVLQSHFPFTLFGQILQTTFPLMPWSLPQLSLFGGLGVFPVSLFPVWLTTPSGFPNCLVSFP